MIINHILIVMFDNLNADKEYRGRQSIQVGKVEDISVGA